MPPITGTALLLLVFVPCDITLSDCIKKCSNESASNESATFGLSFTVYVQTVDLGYAACNVSSMVAVSILSYLKKNERAVCRLMFMVVGRVASCFQPSW